MFFEQMHPEWQEILEAQRANLENIELSLGSESVQPERNLVMRAFHEPPSSTRVVIIGQDPYPNPDHAVGLAFAVPPATQPLPPTLRNILTELGSDLAVDASIARHVNLDGWSEQGVLLLNRHLTTSPGVSLGHNDLGWGSFTDAAVAALDRFNPAPVFVLWGSHAQQVKYLLSPTTFRIIAPHPSPLSAYRGFFGSRPFTQINAELLRRGQTAINWLHA